MVMRAKLTQAFEAIHSTSDMIHSLESAGRIVSEMTRSDPTEPLPKIDALIYAGLGALLIIKAARTFLPSHNQNT